MTRTALCLTQSKLLRVDSEHPATLRVCQIYSRLNLGAVLIQSASFFVLLSRYGSPLRPKWLVTHSSSVLVMFVGPISPKGLFLDGISGIQNPLTVTLCGFESGHR
jgi:hypothetical protein